MPAPTFTSLRPRLQLSTAASAGLLQLGLWGLLAGFYFAWNNRPNFYFDGPIWPLVALQLGFAVLLFNALVYLIIPRWLLRGHYGRALLGAVGLLYAFQSWNYVGSRLALAYLPLDADMRRILRTFYVDHFWANLLSPYGQLEVLMGMLAVLLFPVLISFLAFALVVERRRLRLERQHLALELGYLKSQINPQFLFHTLGSLRQLTQTRDARAPDVVLHLADLMRYTLYETDAERVLLARELEFLADYLALERLRRPATVEMEHTVMGTVSTQQLAPLLLHPFLERLFATLNDDNTAPGPAGRLTSYVAVGPATVDLTLTRTTVAATARPLTYRTQPAVAAALRRLALHYPGRHTVHITEEAHTLRVEIHLQLSA
ncbi:sensor histidine kinase [Hymenobacter psychrophilus]|uniref:Histidine kinase n=1 Tax=Hymenobacter psychrophilus TaxID=651662 RepID=A0A1H3CWP4_9BACT|nr:histidine kinase [Hymenobacter psychrophilus]SDX58547.1 Histidine kinase [Hymenobacter psychrophilus]